MPSVYKWHTSFMEPFIVLLGLGVTILINAESNLMFGEISFVTNAAGNILQLVNGMSTLASGSKNLLEGTGELKSGTSDLYDGIVELCDGSAELNDGTREFEDQTSNMDEQVQEEIDSIMDSIGGEDKEVVSFVSDKNVNTTSVQFVIKTSEIKKADPEPVSEKEEEKTGFTEKLANLFGK